MNLITALINGPLIAWRPDSKVLHAASDESVMRGWPSPKHPRPRTTVDAVCGASRLKLLAVGAKDAALPWPPPARIAPMVRCPECFELSTPKRPRVKFTETAG